MSEKRCKFSRGVCADCGREGPTRRDGKMFQHWCGGRYRMSAPALVSEPKPEFEPAAVAAVIEKLRIAIVESEEFVQLSIYDAALLYQALRPPKTSGG